MILDCHVHLPSPGLDQTMEWEPCTPGTAAAVGYLQRCGVTGVVGSSMRALLAQTPEDVVLAGSGGCAV